MLSPLFFHSFRVDFQHSAWRIRHTNHSQLLMGIAQMVEELVQNKKNQLKPSKTWEKPAVNFAGWMDLPFLFLILPSCKLPTGSSGSGNGKQPENQKWWENFHSFREQPLGLDKQELEDPGWSTSAGASGWGVQGSPPGRRDILMPSCFSVATWKD